jgi:hypothetical protein
MMKLYVLSAFIFMLVVSFIPANNIRKEYQVRDKWIEIHDNQYDCYNSMEYSITDSTIYIDNYAEEGDMYDSNYTPAALLDRKLSKTQRQTFANFMNHFPFDSLKSEYVSGVKKGCDSLRQIYIEINWNGKRKNVQIEDCYQKNIGMLFDMINLLIPQNKPGDALYNPEMLKFDYDPERFQCKN